MKKFIILTASLFVLALSTAITFAQETTRPERFQKADHEFNKTEAAKAFDVSIQKELTGAYEAVATVNPDQILTNHPTLPKLLDEFVDHARYRHIKYHAALKKLHKLVFLDGNQDFLGAVLHEGELIVLNEKLLQYPNLLRIVFFHQMGVLSGLKEISNPGHAIMGTHWAMDLKHEYYAQQILKRPYMQTRYMKNLAEKQGTTI